MMQQPNILILDDEPLDAELVRRTLLAGMPDAAVACARTRVEFEELLAGGGLDAVLADGSVPGCEGLRAFNFARERQPGVPFLFVSKRDHTDILGLKGLGIAEVFSKSDLSGLGEAVRLAIAE